MRPPFAAVPGSRSAVRDLGRLLQVPYITGRLIYWRHPFHLQYSVTAGGHKSLDSYLSPLSPDTSRKPPPMSNRHTSNHTVPASTAPVRGIERGSYLIIVTPVLTMLATLEAELEVVERYDPNGAAKHTLQHVVAELRRAVTRAEELELWGGIEEVVEVTGRPKSTVTEWAQKYGDGAWCWKKSGVWAVDLRKFDAWYRNNLPALESRRREAGESVTAASPGAGGKPALPFREAA